MLFEANHDKLAPGLVRHRVFDEVPPFIWFYVAGGSHMVPLDIFKPIGMRMSYEDDDLLCWRYGMCTFVINPYEFQRLRENEALAR